MPVSRLVNKEQKMPVSRLVNKEQKMPVSRLVNKGRDDDVMMGFKSRRCLYHV